MTHSNAITAVDSLYLATRHLSLPAQQHELLKQGHEELVRHLEQTQTELATLKQQLHESTASIGVQAS